MDELKVYFGILEAAGARHDRRLVGRMANRTGVLRKTMSKDTCMEILSVYAPDCPELNAVFNVQSSSSSSEYNSSSCGGHRSGSEQAFGWLLAVKYLQDHGMLSVPVARAVCERVSAMNRRELDPLLARLVHCLVKAACQDSDSDNGGGNPAQIHGDLMTLLRQSRLRHDHDTMAVAHNGLARLYMMTGQWEMMAKLFSSCQFPSQTAASHNHSARHHYYAARLAAVKLHYQQAMTNVDQALRKSPHHAHAFKAVCNKLLVVVRLLCGDVPALADLKQFGQSEDKHYYQLCKTVRNGDVAGFQVMLQPGSASLQAFQKDNLEGLILRLHQNVVKAGLKRIAVSYSKIPLVDIQRKLGLDSVEDALMIVMKAVRDGVINGKLMNIDSGTTKVFVADKNTQSDAEKADAIHNRILSCQSVIQEAVRSMRFPDRKPFGDRSTMEMDGLGDDNEDGKDMDELDDMVMMEDDFF